MPRTEKSIVRDITGSISLGAELPTSPLPHLQRSGLVSKNLKEGKGTSFFDDTTVAV